MIRTFVQEKAVRTYTLLWKEVILRRRAWIQTPFEILLQLLFIWLIYTIAKQDRIYINQIVAQQGTEMVLGNSVRSVGRAAETQENDRLVYFPSTNFTDQIMNFNANNNDSNGFIVHNRYNSYDDRYNTYPLKSEDELHKYMTKYDKKLVSAFTFYENRNGKLLTDESNIDKGIHIKMRPTLLVSEKSNRKVYNLDAIHVLETLLAAVEQRVVSLQLNQSFEGYNYKKVYKGDKDKGAQSDFAYSVFLCLGTVLTLYVLVKRIVTEKVTKLRELMNLSGLRSKTYNDSLFIFHFIILLPFSIASILILSFLCSAPLVVVAFVWFQITIILYAMAFTVFFSSIEAAKVLFVLCWLGVPILLSLYVGLPIDNSAKEMYCILGCLLAPPPFAIGIFISFCKRFALINRRLLTLRDFFKHVATLKYITVGHILLPLEMQLVISAIIIAYVAEIWPWQEGVPKPWHFPISQFFKKKQTEEDKSIEPTGEYFESPPQELHMIIGVKNVRKRFGLSREVLKGVNLGVYSGQITVLLGHNGAGKTTLMSIMTGLFPPTSGQVLVNGYDVETDTANARKSVGLCPQTNIQFDQLTVEEHLYFFGLMKGYSCRLIRPEIDRVLKLLNLEEHRYLKPDKISGGMKRKLQLAIAFIGGSTILILDEPSSGLDVETRRHIWDLLLSVREKYVILVTTHHMEEADALGDRIAIMSQGEVKCCGSTLFLKNVFGVGYFIRGAKAQNYNAEAFQALMAKHFTAANLFRDTENEIMFNFSKDETAKLPNFLDEIDTLKESVGIASVGVTVTSMDDVFLKVGSVFEHDGDSTNDSKIPSLDKLNEKSTPKFFIYALLLKRFHNMKRSPLTLLFHFFCVLLLSLIFAFLICDRPKYSSNEWQTDLNFEELGYKEAKGICVNNTLFCDKAKSIGDAYKISFSTLDVDNKELELLIEPPTLVGIYVSDLSEIDLPDSSPISIYTPDNEQYASIIATSIVTNTLYALNKSTNTPLTTTTFNPQKTVDILSYQTRVEAIIIIPIMYLILCVFPLLYPAMERSTNVKMLQMMTGIPAYQYWLSNLIFDFLLLTFFSLPFFVIIALFYFISECITIISSFTTFLYFVAIMAIFFLATITMSHFLSFFFTGIALVLLIKVAIIIATVSFLLLPFEFVREVVLTLLQYVLPTHPLLAMYNGLQNVSLIANAHSYCSSVSEIFPNYCQNNADGNISLTCCQESLGNVSQTRLVLDEFIQICLFVLFFITILVIEYMWEKNTSFKATDPSYKPSQQEDEDVLAIREKTLNVFNQKEHSNYALSALNLTKRFDKQPVVDHVSFVVEQKQCFGLLGVNGAGKTTTFRMLVAEIPMTYGESFIGNYSLFDNRKDYRMSIGYCPQFDLFVPNLTGREMLSLFGRLRGYSGDSLREAVEKIIQFVDLQDHAKYVADNYSGGNKRKLSIGMAIIGFPRVIFLDEPTAGVDPVARRKVWLIIETIRKVIGSSVILTSHAMDECEHLCSLIAIMVKGTFRCLGSTQHLKTKFGKGFTIILKLDPNLKNVDAVVNDVSNTLSKAVIKDKHSTQLTYHLDDPDVKLGDVFRYLEDIKQKHKLEDYQVTDSDLEQIFLNFAKIQ